MTNIQEYIQQNMEAGIKSVIEGRLNNVQFDFLVPNAADEYIKALGGVRGDIDTNGWDWDFWVTYTIDNKKYTLAGSGWSGKRWFVLNQEEEQ